MPDFTDKPAIQMARMLRREVCVDHALPRFTRINRPTQQRQPAVASSSRVVNQAQGPEDMDDSARQPRSTHRQNAHDNTAAHVPTNASLGRPEVHSVEARRTKLRPRGDSEPAQFRDREFTVFGILDKKIDCNEVHYLINWKDSVMQRKLVIHRYDGKSFVLIGGEEWDVKEYFEAPDDEEGRLMCSVEWEPSWQAARDLPNAQVAIAAFEKNLAERAIDGADSDVMSTVERRSLARELGRTSTREMAQAASSQRQRDLAYPRQGVPPLLVFKPCANTDYRVGIRTLIRKVEGVSCTTLTHWPEDQDKRPLVIRRSFVEKGCSYDLARGELKRATFAHLAGTEQPRPCECCEKGQGPYLQCVVVAGVFNGACTNCAYRRRSRGCNFHQDSLKEKWESTVRNESLGALGDNRESTVRHEAPPQTASPNPSSPSNSPILDRATQRSKARPQREITLPPTPPISSPPPDIGGLPSPELPSSSPPAAARPFAAVAAKAEQSQDDEWSTVIPAVEDILSNRARQTSSRAAKRSASDAWVHVKSETGTSHSGSDVRPSKSPRLSTARSVAEEVEMNFIHFCENLPVSWITPVSWRHENCNIRHTNRCKDSIMVPGPDPSYRGEARWKVRVFSDKVFKPCEATPEQVKYILNRCPCNFTQAFEDGWREQSNDTHNKCTKERYLSREYTPALNKAVLQFCTKRQLPQGDVEVIIIDGDDE